MALTIGGTQSEMDPEHSFARVEQEAWAGWAQVMHRRGALAQGWHRLCSDARHCCSVDRVARVVCDGGRCAVVISGATHQFAPLRV